MNFLADFGEGLLVFLIASFPIMLILGAIAVIIVLIVKASQKAKRKRASRNNNQGPMGGSN